MEAWPALGMFSATPAFLLPDCHVFGQKERRDLDQSIHSPTSSRTSKLCPYLCHQGRRISGQVARDTTEARL